MEVLSIVLLLVISIIIFNIVIEEKNKLPSEVIDSEEVDTEDVVTTDTENNLVESRGDSSLPHNDKLGDFPIPPSSSSSTRLSPDFQEDLSIINNVSIPNKDIIDVVRTTISTNDSYYPKYYRKDNMSGNTVGTTELSFSGVTSDKPSPSFTDYNVSQLPKYYKSDFKGGLTNPGDFFDVNNNYVDITGPRSVANVDELCYTSKEGEKVCLQNDKLQNIAPKVVNNVSSCGFLNNIGLLEFSQKINESDEKVSNGGILYNNVLGSTGINSLYSEPIKQPILDCSV